MLAGGEVREENCEDDEKVFNDGECVNRKCFGRWILMVIFREIKSFKFGSYGNSLKDLNDFFWKCHLRLR